MWNFKPDVITLDLEMPRMDGMEALRQIMEHHHLPVIVVSAHNETGAYSALSALALGAFDFVAKPRDGEPSTLEQMGRELMLKIKVASMVGAPKQILHPPQDAKNGRGNSSASAQPVESSPSESPLGARTLWNISFRSSRTILGDAS